MTIKSFLSLCLLLMLCPMFVKGQTSNDKQISFTVSSAPWNLILPKGDWVIEEPKLKSDGRAGYFLMNDEKNKMTLSFFIEPAINCKDSKSCRDMVWKLGNPGWENPQKVVQSEIDGVSRFEFLMPTFQGKPINQQHIYVEYVIDGYWVDLHLSKVLYKAEEHELFERIIKSIKFEAKKTETNGQKPSTKSSYDYAQEGSSFFLKGSYQKAIEPYQKALDLEKEQPKLNKTIWRVLIDNLAMSYGITGNLPKAKEVLEYGISKDPDYPMFYYIMANTYGEMNDEDNAIVYLKRAFDRRGNMIAGETIPDPMTDDSFQRFAKSEKFLKAVKELKQKK